MGVEGLKQYLKAAGCGKTVNLTEMAKTSPDKVVKIACDAYALLYFLLEHRYTFMVPEKTPTPAPVDLSAAETAPVATQATTTETPAAAAAPVVTAPVAETPAAPVMVPTKRKLDWLHGGQHMQLAQNIEEFLRRLLKGGVQLCPVVFDGPAPADKLPESVRRQTQAALDMKGVWQDVCINGGSQSASKRSPSTPLLSVNVLWSVLENEGVECIKAFGEADLPLAYYASERGCFAVLSGDTDFVVMEDAPALIPLESLLVPEAAEADITATVFIQKEISEKLGVDQKLFPLLGALSGNDLTRGFAKTLPSRGTVHDTVEFVKRVKSQLLPKLAKPQLMAETVTTNGDYARILADAIQRYSWRAQVTTQSVNKHPAQLPEALVAPYRSGKLRILGPVLMHNRVLHPIMLEDTGARPSKHGKHTPLVSPIATLSHPLRTALYSIALPTGTKITEYFNNKGNYAALDLTVNAAWPAADEAITLAKLIETPREKRVALFHCLFKVKEGANIQGLQLVADKPHDTMEDVVALMLSYVTGGCNAGLSASELHCIIRYFQARKLALPPVTSLSYFGDADHTMVGRRVHLFNLFQHLYEMMTELNEVFGNPLGTHLPPPQQLFDGATWQLALHKPEAHAELAGDWFNLFGASHVLPTPALLATTSTTPLLPAEGAEATTTEAAAAAAATPTKAPAPKQTPKKKAAKTPKKKSPQPNKAGGVRNAFDFLDDEDS